MDTNRRMRAWSAPSCVRIDPPGAMRGCIRGTSWPTVRARLNRGSPRTNFVSS
ncbi:hypothetical protein [Lentzea pudingi]|uniref:hypothetical protein n=1 Tax=Lentzea pudingi TaxID=1789439 RepID=UPI0027E4BDBC|nr:hypothetical protein [Lentzea pudingi]